LENGAPATAQSSSGGSICLPRIDSLTNPRHRLGPTRPAPYRFDTTSCSFRFDVNPCPGNIVEQ
jgi:hypothetical protein